MIFPTRAPAPQMRPSMGYAAGSNAFGYVAHMGYLPGTSTLGAISATMQSNALAGGVAQSDLDLLNSLGATDNDIQDLLNGTITLSALYAQYGVNVSPPAAAASTGVPPESPSGSTLVFVCNWTAGVGNLSVSPNSAIASLTKQLSDYGMSIVSSQTTSNGPIHYGIQCTILDSIGHAKIADALSVLQSLMAGIVGNNFSSTPTLSLVSSGASSGGTGLVPTPPPSTDLATWLENNALYIGLGIAGLVVLQSFMGKRR